MSWWDIAKIIYYIVLVFTVVRIIYDTRDPSKALGYLLVCIAFPLVGVIVYWAIGVNMRKQKLYADKWVNEKELEQDFARNAEAEAERIIASDDTLAQDARLIRLMVKRNYSPLTDDNEVEVLLNGEKKFPRVIQTIASAKHHVHVEYYRFEDDVIGRQLEEALRDRARAGVKVRVIYDDFGSSTIDDGLSERLKQDGVEVEAFYEITFMSLANRLNYRNHRKIIVVDGTTAFVGGINVSQDYFNGPPAKSELYWRDTHLMIRGGAVRHLQYVFLNDWNFCCSDRKGVPMNNDDYFPKSIPSAGNKAVQITASGPDSDSPTILYSMIQAIDLAEDRVLITTPYFIPSESLLDNICIAAGAGIDVILLVPLEGDSKVVNYAAESYYARLLEAGVRIYRYKKGFVHAKSMVIDDRLATVGTANLDIRSFDLNFEVNAIIYDTETATELAACFYDDLEEAEQLDIEEWKERGHIRTFLQRLARLLSPVL